MTGIENMIAQLAWRGPNDKPMGHVVLSRAQADEVLTEIERLRTLMLGNAGRYWEGRWRDADAEVKRLTDEMLKVLRDGAVFKAAARVIVCEEWQLAVKQYGLTPGTVTEVVVSKILNRLDNAAHRTES